MKRSKALIRLAVGLLMLAAVFQIPVPAAQSAQCATEGAIRDVTTGPLCSCEDFKTPKDRYKCIGGVWVYQYSFCGTPFCQEP